MISLKNITKQFGDTYALREVSIDFPPGKVVALVGENGAGKSTLMNILSGVYQDFAGELHYRGQRVQFRNPKEALEKGIAIIHQELNLIPQLSVMENIFLGQELSTPLGTLDRKAMYAKSKALLARLRLEVDPHAEVAGLKVGERQVVEIAKALLVDSEVVIMDEPTSAISETEVKALFSIVTDLKRAGKTVIYISHKMSELFEIADEYIVLRDGIVVQQGDMAHVDEKKLIAWMVGRTLADVQQTESRAQTAVALRVANLTIPHASKAGMLLEDVSFELYKGEILGVFGLMGAGRTELLEVLFGLRGMPIAGSLFLDGSPVPFFRSPAGAICSGLALIPEDRKQDGIVAGLDVQSNLTLAVLGTLERGGMLDASRARQSCQHYIECLSIKVASARQAIGSLSGGNQQKVVLAKYLATGPQVRMMDEPTRGIDVGAKQEIYRLIRTQAQSGLGIMVVSSELPELFAIADRVLVMCEGRITRTLSMRQATEETILEAALPKTVAGS